MKGCHTSKSNSSIHLHGRDRVALFIPILLQHPKELDNMNSCLVNGRHFRLLKIGDFFSDPVFLCFSQGSLMIGP